MCRSECLLRISRLNIAAEIIARLLEKHISDSKALITDADMVETFYVRINCSNRNILWKNTVN